MTEITYKPAPLASRQSLDPDANRLIMRDAGGEEKWRMDWDQIERAHYIEHPMKGVFMRRLDLIGGDPVKRRSISCTSPYGLPLEGSDAALYLGLIATILERLVSERPEFTVTLGEHGWSRRIMFGIGVLSLLFGVGILALMLATGVSSDRLIGGAVPMLLMAGIGGSLIWAYSPWRAQHESPAAKLADSLRAMVEAGKRTGDQG